MPSGEFTHASDMSVLGDAAITDKEEDYRAIPGVKSVEAKTPADAKKEMSKDCKCEVEYERSL